MKTEQEQRAWEAQGEQLASKLLRVLQQRTGIPGLSYAVEPVPLAGGHWASLYRFRLSQAPPALSGDLVLRVMPTSDEQCLREATIQAAVAAAGFPAPRVHFSGGRDAGLGFPFILMAAAEGENAAASFRLPAVLGETMARLHAIDAEPVAQALAAAGAKPLGLETLLDDLAGRAAPLADRGFAAGAAWLQRTAPRAGMRAVCHGDLHPFNLMMTGSRVSGLIDWSQALLADPAFDVAYTYQLLALWPIDLAVVPRWLGRGIGRLAADRFLRAYRSWSLGDLSWYEALHSFRLILRVALARTGATVPPLADKHPWELVADAAAAAFARRSGIRAELPPR